MKNLITIIAISLLTFTAASANNNPESAKVTVENLEIFASSDFDSATEMLEFTTVESMAAVQIFDAAGEMTFILPVMSDNVQINKNLFEQGTYKLGFILEGQSSVHFSTVTIN